MSILFTYKASLICAGVLKYKYCKYTMKCYSIIQSTCSPMARILQVLFVDLRRSTGISGASSKHEQEDHHLHFHLVLLFLSCCQVSLLVLTEDLVDGMADVRLIYTGGSLCNIDLFYNRTMQRWSYIRLIVTLISNFSVLY